jgi:hypothetical protein
VAVTYQLEREDGHRPTRPTLRAAVPTWKTSADPVLLPHGEYSAPIRVRSRCRSGCLAGSRRRGLTDCCE